jgi:F-type H+-transporting ATPase subunit epsilon
MLEYNTSEGQVGVLPGHVAMTQILAPGKLTIYEENNENPTYIAVMSGISKIMPDTVVLLTEVAELAGEIDVERAESAKDRAEKRLTEKNPNIDMDRAAAALRRALARLEVAKIR